MTGVCSAANAPLVKSLGAEQVVDYSREDFAQAREAYDIILDAVGNCTFARCKLALAADGRLLLVDGGPTPYRGVTKTVACTMVFTKRLRATSAAIVAVPVLLCPFASQPT